jgi:hypothetical protein
LIPPFQVRILAPQSEIDADAKALRQIRSKLFPVLDGKGPIVPTIGPTLRAAGCGIDQGFERFQIGLFRLRSFLGTKVLTG